MKTLVLIFMTFAMVGNSQQIDTIYSEVGKIVAKKVNLTVNQVNGDQLTQVKETITFDKAIKKIETLQRDTANFTQYLQQLNQTENQIQVERKRIRMMRRDAIDLLDRLKKLLPSLQ
ncbi:MAG: hypothetical protein WAT37_03280 [Saprospiraceae bacterium]